MEEDIKREAFVSTNENAASNEDDINTCYVQYKQGRHLVSVTLVTCNANFKSDNNSGIHLIKLNLTTKQGPLKNTRGGSNTSWG